MSADAQIGPASLMLPVHDHFTLTSQFAYDALFDGYHHDPRCMGDCGPCGGVGGVPGTGPDGEMAMTCLYCGGSGRCQGCNFYVTEQARERGLVA